MTKKVDLVARATRKQRLKRGLLASSTLLAFAVTDIGTAFAQLDEITVTARKREESLQSVPVAVSAFNENQLDRYQIETMRDIAEQMPALVIQQGGSGSGGAIYLRGLGSSAISAAFDTAVAFNIDGVMANTGRLVQNAFLDMNQVEVLKGPQSLYFGKSASAGVISITSNNPTDEFMAQGMLSYEFEERGTSGEVVVSGPVSDQIGFRVAMRASDISRVVENTSPRASKHWWGEDSFDSRVTLTYTDDDRFDATFKFAYSKYEADSATMASDMYCQGDTAQVVNYGLLLSFPGGYDCNAFDNKVQYGDANSGEALGITEWTGVDLAFLSLFSPGGPDFSTIMPTAPTASGAQTPGNNDGAPFQTQKIMFGSLNMNYELTDEITVTSVTGFYDLDENGLFNYGYTNYGAGGGLTDNTTESFSEEIRIANDGERFSWLLGYYFQTRDIEFNTDQHALGLWAAGIVDPRPGAHTSDWRKEHHTDAKAHSLFGSVSFDMTDKLNITGGLRWSKEKKTNRIDLPYMHPFMAVLGFLPEGSSITGIKYSDSNISPEVSVKYQLAENTMMYIAYKTGYKSGGIDNSALPSAGLGAIAASGDFSSMVYKEETVKGAEVGWKSDLADGTIRLNAVAYLYDYEDLQIQDFDQANTTFITYNAGAIRQQGFDIEVKIVPGNGLSLGVAYNYNDLYSTETYFTPEGIKVLSGQRGIASPKSSLNFDGNYEMLVPNTSLVVNAGMGLKYSGSYDTSTEPFSYYQDSFWKVNAALSVGQEDGRWQLALIGKNITDEIEGKAGTGGRPFTTPDANGASDQIIQVGRGRQIYLEARARF